MDNKLVLKYSKLVYKLAHSFTGYNSIEDLYQAGYKGLILAYKNFDQNMGVKFSTYAYLYIYGEMNKYVREDYNIKPSTYYKKMKLQIEKARIILMQELMREPSISELSTYLNIDEKEIEDVLKVNLKTESLDNPIKSDGKELTLYDVVSSHELELDTLVALKEELNNLSKKEQDIIKKRYFNDLSQSEVATELGMTQVQVSREEKKIKEKIKKRLLV